MQKQIQTFNDLFHELQRLEGRRLCLLRAAEKLEQECAATEMGPAVRPLRSVDLFETVVPDDIVYQIVADMRIEARELEGERDRLKNALLTVKKGDHSARTSKAAPRRPVRAVAV